MATIQITDSDPRFDPSKPFTVVEGELDIDIAVGTKAKRKKKFVYDGNPWPVYWDVSFEWEFDGKPVVTRKNDIKIRLKPGGRNATTWVQFNRVVHNTQIDTWWVDGWDNCGFVSYRLEQVIGVRPRRERKGLVRNTEPTRRGRKRKAT